MNKKKPATPKDDQLAQANYNRAARLCKPALYLLLAGAYLPSYCALIIALPLLPTRLANRLIDWLAVDQGGV